MEAIKGLVDKTLTVSRGVSSERIIVAIRRNGILESALDVNKGDLEWLLMGDLPV